ncbi:MAG TPA: transcription antitermination factor NusB [Clostridia bacterium]|jgi:N utilization substance protein B|nr:transcription antitermination factor NusB [Clostridia bacterium]
MSITTRRKARDSVYKLVFEYLFTNKINQKLLETTYIVNLPKEDVEYTQTVYFGVIERFQDLKIYVEKYAEGFVFERIYKTDLAAILIATYEIIYMKDIPNNVAIAEAIELVKKYSTPKSGSFVNGVLSAINKDVSKG